MREKTSVRSISVQKPWLLSQNNDSVRSLSSILTSTQKKLTTLRSSISGSRPRSVHLNHVEGISPKVEEQLQQWLYRARRRLEIKMQNTNRQRILLPDSDTRACWDLLGLMLMAWTSFEIPFSMLFRDEQEMCVWDKMAVFNTLVDTLFCIDIAVSFNTAYYNDEGILIEFRTSIALHYLKTWFLIDLGTSLPIDALVCLFSGGTGANTLIMRVIKIVRILKLARMFKFLKILKKWQSMSGSKALRAAIKIIQFFSFLIFTTHVAACCWMGT
jgi:hypothetical protein